MTLNELRDEIFSIAREKGWWEGREVGVDGDSSTVTVDRSFGELMMLVVSECSEALEEWRQGYEPNKPRWQVIKEASPARQPQSSISGTNEGIVLHMPFGSKAIDLNSQFDRTLLRDEGFSVKPIGIPSELADIIIRVLDICGAYGVDIGEAVAAKVEFNKTRPYRHGGKLA